MAVHFEDRAMVKRLLAGDQKAFDQFFDQHFSRLYRFVTTRLPEDPASAEEIVQSSLARALRNIHRYRGEAALFTWLCVICRNELSDWLRRNARHREHLVLAEDLPQIRQVIEALDAPLEQSPESKFQRDEAARLIQVALDRLPARYGDALEWKYIQGYSVKEIAGRLGLSHEATQSLLARARKSFKEVYSTLAESLFEQPVSGSLSS